MSRDLKPIVITVAIMMGMAVTAAAQNLVINGDFEDGNTCQEFHLPCGPAAWVTLPIKTKMVFYGTEKKKDANHHFGAILENTRNPINGRTYAQTMLCQPLVAGRRYRLTMRCSAGPAPFERAGVLLSNDEIIDGLDTLSTLKASFEITADSVQNKTDLTKWLTVQYTFTATGGEQFLMLGNFSKTYSPRKEEYTRDALGDIVLSVDDIHLAPETGDLPDIDTSCAILKRRLYSQHLRHTPYIYLLGETKNVTAPPQTVVSKPSPETTKAAIEPPPVKRVNNALPPVSNDTLRIPIPFDVNSSVLGAGYTASLDSILSRVLPKSYKKLIIVGHTDSTGSKSLNRKLSLQRARRVATYFIQEGKIPAAKVQVAGHADEEPISSNSTPEGRQQNRRVEIIVLR